MKRIWTLLLAVILLGTACARRGEPVSTVSGENSSGGETINAVSYDDGRARPSNSGRLQVKNGKLSDRDGQPVMLRGVSFNGLITSESFLNDQLFAELAGDDGVNLAEQYSGYDNVLYEICNEPNGVDWATVKGYAEEIIPIIREKAPESVVIVGNPDWSKDLYSVAADPLAFENVLYTLHFYSATHGEPYREMTRELSQKGLPIFVSEFGVTAASGDLPRDLDEADRWIDLLEQENISYCLWAFSKVAEACSTVRATVPKYSGFVQEDYTATGLWLLDTLQKHATR